MQILELTAWIAQQYHLSVCMHSPKQYHRKCIKCVCPYHSGGMSPVNSILFTFEHALCHRYFLNVLPQTGVPSFPSMDGSCSQECVLVLPHHDPMNSVWATLIYNSCVILLFSRAVGDRFGVSKSTVFHCVQRVGVALLGMASRFVAWPSERAVYHRWLPEEISLPLCAGSN